MKRIVIDARESGTSTGRYVDKLIEYLQTIDKTNDYQILYKRHRLGLLKSTNFHEVICDVKEFTFAEQIKLLKQIKDLKPDLVHFPMVQQPILYRGKVVTTMQDLTTLRFINPAKNIFIFRLKRIVYRFVNKLVAKKSRAIITISQFVKDDLVKFTSIKPSKITVTYEAADKIDETAVQSIYLKDVPFLLYVGRPQPHKNLGRLIDAFNILHKKNPELKLVLAGKKDVLFQQHEKRARELGLEKSVVFTDFVSEGQLRWLYENCQAYVFPSLSEGFGLPGLEAMVHGAPVVSSNATCLPEVYGHAAHYFSPYSTKDMAEKIDDVLSNKTLRSTLIERGREQAKKYSWARLAKQTLEIYEKALL